MKVHQYFGQNFQRVSLLRHPMVLGTHQVGVEVELENVVDWEMNSEYWVIKEDGSLRNNGREFVFRGPTGGKDLYNALVELDEFLGERNPDGNWRCSTHMHLDVREMNVKQLKMMILAYLVAEKALFRLTAMHRYTNNFCAAIGFAQEQLQILVNAWDTNDVGQFWRKIEGWNKYSALNLIPMHNFGSVEFRMSDAKWKKNDLLLLCNRFLALKELAMHWEGSEEELVAFMINTPIHEVFPKGIPVDMPEGFLTEDMAVGHKLAFDLLTFQAQAANIQRQPVEIPEVRGGDGEWNHIGQEEQGEIIHFLVRAGLDGEKIRKALYDEAADEADPEVSPAMKIRSHVVCRHMWANYLGNFGLRMPQGEMPSLFPVGVVRNLLRNNRANVIGLFPLDRVIHLVPEEFRDNLMGNQDNVFQAPPPQPVRARVRAGRLGGAAQADVGGEARFFNPVQWQVAEDDDFNPVADEEPF